MSLQTKYIYEFGPFRLDAAEHLLLRDGKAVPLTPKAFDLLLALVERHGHLLEKDELLKKVWPDTFVEEANLASNISQLRKALGDGENGQRYIETAPKRGYRFVASVKKVAEEREELKIHEQSGSQIAGANGEPASNAGELITAHPATKAEGLTSKIKSHKRRVLLLLGLLLIVGAGIVYLFLKPPAMPMVSEYRQITSDSLPKTAPLLNLVTSLATDGSRVYFIERRDGRLALAQVAATGGETVLIPTPFSNTTVLGISANGSELLIGGPVQAGVALPIWVMPVPGGSPRRLGDITGGSAAWSPDGRQIAYASGPALHLVKPDGTESRKLVTLDGRPSQVRWSPDGGRLRFTVGSFVEGKPPALWEVNADGSNLHLLLPDWNDASACCGNWTPDGKYYVFQATVNKSTQIWALREPGGLFAPSRSEPVQLTSGPMSFLLPVPSRDGSKIFVVGRQERGELVRYDAAARQFVPYLKDLSAEQLDYSRDRDWVAYVTYPEGDLWRRKLDGAERLQLSFAPMQAALPRWSPDGKRIAFVGRLPGKSWKVHLVSSEGGAPRQLMPEDRVELDPNWSPDGNTLVFVDYSAATIHLFDLRTGQVSMLPGSEGLHSPRWSPDGRYIAATLRNGQGMTLYDFTTQKWTEIARQSSFWQFWSRDSKHLYFSSGLQRDPAIFRLRIADRSVEQMASLADFRLGIGLFGSWTGLTADESPLALRDVGTQDIYALEWRIP